MEAGVGKVNGGGELTTWILSSFQDEQFPSFIGPSLRVTWTGWSGQSLKLLLLKNLNLFPLLPLDIFRYVSWQKYLRPNTHSKLSALVERLVTLIPFCEVFTLLVVINFLIYICTL